MGAVQPVTMPSDIAKRVPKKYLILELNIYTRSIKYFFYKYDLLSVKTEREQQRLFVSGLTYGILMIDNTIKTGMSSGTVDD